MQLKVDEDMDPFDDEAVTDFMRPLVAFQDASAQQQYKQMFQEKAKKHLKSLQATLKNGDESGEDLEDFVFELMRTLPVYAFDIQSPIPSSPSPSEKRISTGKKRRSFFDQDDTAERISFTDAESV